MKKIKSTEVQIDGKAPGSERKRAPEFELDKRISTLTALCLMTVNMWTKKSNHQFHSKLNALRIRGNGGDRDVQWRSDALVYIPTRSIADS